jgi:hypothetical protein
MARLHVLGRTQLFARDLFFSQKEVRMANDRTEIGFEWPIGLTLRDVYRVLWGRWHARMPEVIAELAKDGKILLLEDAYAIAEDIQKVSDVMGCFFLDPSEEPKRFTPPDMPSCVLAAQYGEFISPTKMQEILLLYKGENLPKDLSQEERAVRIPQQHRRLVLSRRCRHEGCTETITVTVGMAAHAILSHKLLERGLCYEPPSLCMRHRDERDASMFERRSNTKDLSKKRKGKGKKGKGKGKKGKGKALAAVGDLGNNKKALENVAKLSQDPALNENENKENENGDCPVSAAAPVEESQPEMS